MVQSTKDKVRVDFIVWRKPLLLIFSENIMCIRYDEKTFACRLGNKIKLVDESKITEREQEKFKLLDTQKYLQGKAFLRTAVDTKKNFECDYKFLEGYMGSITRIQSWVTR